MTTLDLQIRDGEFMVLVGPSGCGKTTALRMLAGLEEISDGELVIDDTVVNDVAPQKRDIAMVFQNYALYPHLSVYDNMAYGLKIQKLSKSEIKQRVHEIAERDRAQELLDRKPKALSGGQRQRVAMGRAIVRRPKVFLMDEPLSNLDAKLRVQMRSEVARIQHELKATTVYVTHDQVEAMTMGDRVALMRRGVLQQVDTPMRLYNAPANLFVASFIGSPAMNLFEAQLDRRNGHLVASDRRPVPAPGPDALADPASSSATRAARSRSASGPSTSRTRRSRPDAPSERRLQRHGHDRRGARRRADRPPRDRRAGRCMTDEVKEIAADLDDTAVAELEAEARTTSCRWSAASTSPRAPAPTRRVEVVVDTSQRALLRPRHRRRDRRHPVAGV